MHKPGNERIQQAQPHRAQALAPAATKAPEYGKIGIPAVAAILCVRASHEKMRARKGVSDR